MNQINEIDVVTTPDQTSAPDTLQFPHDHAEIAWSHFLLQHVGKKRTEDFVRAFYPPLNELDNALNDLYTKRWLETAEGVQLDGIGSIVGISRTVNNAIYIPFFGFSLHKQAVARLALRECVVSVNLMRKASFFGDIEYRAMIYLKIALNNGHGTAEELIATFDTVLGVTGTRVVDVGNANARVYINDFIMPYDPRSQLLEAEHGSESLRAFSCGHTMLMRITSLASPIRTWVIMVSISEY